MHNIHPALSAMKSNRESRKCWVHMMGIGGIGMSAIAQLLLKNGYKVSGCDTNLNLLTEKLKNMGAVIYKGHNTFHIDKDVELVVHSSAVKGDHPELLTAKHCSIPIYRRAEMLGQVVKDKLTIAVTGTHGKTTTSFMITHILNCAGFYPGFAIGGEVKELGGNARWGDGRYFILEADESDGTHIYLYPQIAVITNIDLDHMEHYSNISDIASVMQKFIDKIPVNGLAVGCGDDPEILKIFKKTNVPILTYGWAEVNNLYPVDIELSAWNSKFNLCLKDKKMGNVNLSIPGRHNILNALASIGVCLNLGVTFDKIVSALNRFPGVDRRLDVVYEDNEITVMDDYAHHPNEIRAVISTVRKMADNRLIGIFQPHRFTRTKFLASNFKDCFIGLDKLILTDIYSAGELPIPGVTGRLIYNEAIKNNYTDTIYIESKEDIPGYLIPQFRKGDLAIFMGAGDITDIAHRIGEHIGMGKKDEVRV